MLKTHRALVGPISVGVAVVLLTGCGSGTTTSAPTSVSTSSVSTTSSASSDSAQEQQDAAGVCDAAAAHDEAVTDFQSILTSDVTIEQLRSARDEVVDTYTELGRAAADVAAERLAAVGTAERSFRKAVDDIPDQTTVPEAIDSLRDEAAQLKVAVKNLLEEVSC